MIRHRTAALAAAALLLVSAGCSRSPRVTFYTLETAQRQPAAAQPSVAAPAGSVSVAEPRGAAAPVAGSVGAPAVAPARITVGPVTLPELVDRPQLVVRVAPNRVEMLEMQRWAEPLKAGIARVVAARLGQLLPASRVASRQEQAGYEADCRVLLDVERLDASATGEVVLEAVWTLRGAADTAARSGRFQVRDQAGTAYDEMVAGYGRLFDALARQLSRELAGAPPAAPPKP